MNLAPSTYRTGEGVRVALSGIPQNKNAGQVCPARSLSFICGARLVYVSVPADLLKILLKTVTAIKKPLVTSPMQDFPALYGARAAHSQPFQPGQPRHRRPVAIPHSPGPLRRPGPVRRPRGSQLTHLAAGRSA